MAVLKVGEEGEGEEGRGRERNIYEREKVEERLGKLSNGVAVLKVGGERGGVEDRRVLGSVWRERGEGEGERG